MAGLAKRDLPAKNETADEGKAGRLIDGKWVSVGDTVRITGKRGTWTVRSFVLSPSKGWCACVYQQMERTFPVDQVKP